MSSHPHQLGPGRRHAVIIACNAPPLADKAPLTSPEAESAALATILADPTHYAFEVKAFLGAESRSQEVQDYLQTLLTNLGPDDGVVVIWSGHGVIWGDDLVLATADMNSDTREGGISSRWLHETLFLHQSLGHLVLILNCCHAAAGAASTDFLGQIKTTFEDNGRAYGNVKTRVLIAAAQTDEAALEAQGQSALLSRVVAGCQGAAHVGGKVTSESLWQYLQDTMSALRQRPVFVQWSTIGSFVLAWHEHLQPMTKGDVHVISRAKPDPETMLAEALTALASLPLAPLPEPSALLPATSRLPFDRVASFVGHDDDLRMIAAAIRNPDPTAVTALVASGIGGVGKTTLAIEASFRFGRYFHGGVFWISCAEATLVESELLACAPALGIVLDALAPEDWLPAVRRALQQPIPRLLIFDNCEDPAILDAYKPTLGGCRVLVTSRRERWPTATTIAVGVLARAESRALLQGLCPRLTDAEAEAIAADLGDLPLALHLAGSYLQEYATTAVATYRQRLQEQGLDERSLQGRGTPSLPTRHERIVAATFALSHSQLNAADARDALALQLFAGFAHCAPGVLIPQALVAALAPEATDPDDLHDAVARLRELGLVTGTDPVLHRLITLFAQRDPQTDALASVAEAALLAVSRTMLDTGLPLAMIPILPHLEHTVLHARPRQDATTASLVHHLAGVYLSQGRYGEAEAGYAEALALRRAVLPEGHPDIATSLHHLAGVYLSQGRYGEAEAGYAEALALRRAGLPEGHPDIASSLNNLAGVYRAQGRYGEAESLLEEGLAIYRAVLPAGHPAIATSLHNLAHVYESQGRYGEAEAGYAEALALSRAGLPAGHPAIATSLHNLAGVYRAQGRYGEAESLLEEGLALSRAGLPAGHPDIATSLNSLASVYEAQGRYGEAESLLEEGLAILRAGLPAGHPDIARSLHNLASVYALQGRYGEAEAGYAEALAIKRAVLPEGHPEIATSLHNLAGVYRAQGRYGAAETAHTEALAIKRAGLPKGHPDIARSLHNLANVYFAQGRYGEAEAGYAEALALRRAGLPAGHPEIATSLHNLAMVYEAQGRYGEAEAGYAEALTIAQAALGAEHPHTQMMAANLAAVRAKRGAEDGA